MRRHEQPAAKAPGDQPQEQPRGKAEALPTVDADRGIAPRTTHRFPDGYGVTPRTQADARRSASAPGDLFGEVDEQRRLAAAVRADDRGRPTEAIQPLDQQAHVDAASRGIA
ncbi:MAG: hypothetical protein ACKOHG_15280 [Planctomycetia bacterium]